MPRNKTRLYQLAQYLRYNIENKDFDMKYYFERPSPTSFGAFKNGTRCAGGVALSIFAPSASFANGTAALQLMRIFDIGEEEVSDLFQNGDLFSLNRHEMANVIENFASSGYVEKKARTYSSALLPTDYRIVGQKLKPQPGDEIIVRLKVTEQPPHASFGDNIRVNGGKAGNWWLDPALVQEVIKNPIEVGSTVTWNSGHEGEVLALDGSYAFVRPTSGPNLSLLVSALTVKI